MSILNERQISKYYDLYSKKYATLAEKAALEDKYSKAYFGAMFEVVVRDISLKKGKAPSENVKVSTNILNQALNQMFEGRAAMKASEKQQLSVLRALNRPNLYADLGPDLSQELTDLLSQTNYDGMSRRGWARFHAYRVYDWLSIHGEEAYQHFFNS